MSYKRRTLSPDSPYAIIASVLLFTAAAVLFVNLAWDIFNTSFGNAAIKYILPMGSCIALGWMLLARKNNLMPTIVPMIIGCSAFALRTITLEVWQCVVASTLYTVFAIIYVLTVCGVISSRSWLLALCGVPFTFHLFVEDLFLGKFDGIISILPEAAVLMTMIAIFCVTLGMRRGRLYN